MPPERTAQLVYELDAWYRSHTVRQKDLAAELGLSPQQLAEILSLRNRPTGEQALRIAEFLNAQTMKPELVDPPTMPRESTRDPNEPRTLHEAKEMIDSLRSELKSKPAAATALTPAPTPPTDSPAPKPAVHLPATVGPATPKSAWEKEVDRAHQAATANLSSKPLAEQSILELRSALNAEKDSAARFTIYSTLKEREAEIAALKRNPLARQAKRNSAPKQTAEQAPPFDPEKDLPNFKRMEVAPVPGPESPSSVG